MSTGMLTVAAGKADAQSVLAKAQGLMREDSGMTARGQVI